MVEVVHGLHEAVVQLADDVGLRHLDIVEGDEGSATGPHARAVHLPGLNAWHGPLHQEHAQTLLPRARGSGLHDDREVVSVDAVGDPLLLPVHHEVVPGIVCPAGQGSHVATSRGLCDAEANDLLAAQALLDAPRLQGLVARNAEVHHGRQANAQASHDSPRDSAADARGLINDDKLMEVVVILWGLAVRVVLRPRLAHSTRQNSTLAALGVGLVHVLVALLQLPFHGALLPIIQDRLQHFLAVVTDVLAPGSMGGLVERSVQALVPCGVAQRHSITEGGKSRHAGQVAANRLRSKWLEPKFLACQPASEALPCSPDMSVPCWLMYETLRRRTLGWYCPQAMVPKDNDT